MLTRFITALGVVMCLTACVTHKTTGLTLSGTPDSPFTARYQCGTIDGTVTGKMSGENPDQILEVSGHDFSCDIVKADPGATLHAEVLQNGRPTFHAEAPPGTKTIRISRKNGHWLQEQN